MPAEESKAARTAAGTTTAPVSGRERLQQMQDDQARQAKKKRVFALVGALLALILVAVAIMWGVSRDGDKPAAKASDSSFIPSVTQVPAAAFDAVGAGTTTPGQFQNLTAAEAMTQDGKPRVVYVGGEFCPWCAMDRWSLVAALSRFGSFAGLKPQVSKDGEGPISNIQTMTFRDATYTSKYLAFKTYEIEDRDRNPLQKLSPADQALFDKFNPKGDIPWIDWGGQVTGGTFDESSIIPGKTSTQIASALKDPSTDVSKAVLGSANVMSAQICRLTKNQPATVCDSTGVKAAEKNLAD